MNEKEECNCKKTARIVQKYTNDNTFEKLNGCKRVVEFLKNTLMLLLVVSIFIIIIPFGLLHVIYKMFKGNKLNINISKLISIFHVKKS